VLAPREAYQCGFHIVKQGCPGTVDCLSARNEYIIGSRLPVEGQEQACSGAQTSSGAVADHGLSNFSGGGESRPEGTCRIILTWAHLDDHRRFCNARRFPCAQKIAPPGDPRGAIGIVGPL